MFLESIHLQGFLSFPPDAPPIPLKALNVLIGPNGSGKSNILEAFSLLRVVPNDLSSAIRLMGPVGEWVWSGKNAQEGSAKIELQYGDSGYSEKLVYGLVLHPYSLLAEVVEEYIKEKTEGSGKKMTFPYYHYKKNSFGKILKTINNEDVFSEIEDGEISPFESVLSQKKDRYIYYYMNDIVERLENIHVFPDWIFGRASLARRAQDAGGLTDRLLPNAENLAVFVNAVQFTKERELNLALQRFLPRFVSVKTKIENGSAQIFFMEKGIDVPVSSIRLSDGTLRFIAIVATLLNPKPPSILCLEEPELGMHPDAAALLAELLVEASQRMQIIVTTHSEAFLSALTRHDVNVLVTENFGQGTEVTQVDQEELSSWLDKYTLGDLWRIGKIGGNP
jgi:predicted ATPase